MFAYLAVRVRLVLFCISSRLVRIVDPERRIRSCLLRFECDLGTRAKGGPVVHSWLSMRERRQMYFSIVLCEMFATLLVWREDGEMVW